MRRRKSTGRILVVGPLPPPPFGIATSIGYLQELAERDDLPLVFLDIADRRGLANIGLLELGNVFLALRHGLEFVWLLVRRRPRVVYASLSQGRLGFLRDCLFLTPARLTGRKVVIHLHGGFFRRFYDAQPWWFRALMRWQLRGADRIIVLGERFRGLFDGVVPRERVRVIPNGVPVGPRPAAPPAGETEDDHDHDREELTVLYLGAVCENKGVLDLLDAMGEVRERVPGVRLTLAGESYPWEEDAIRAAIEGNGLSEVVERPGVVRGEAKSEAFRAADVFVFPSRNPVGEGQPFVLLEAMAAALPVVTTDMGTAADTVVDGETGLVVPPADPSAMAAAVVRLLASPLLRKEMGEAGYERVRQEYSLERWRDAMFEVFEEVTGG